MVKNGLIRRYILVGSRTSSNYWWAWTLLLGGIGFLLTGISSFFQTPILFFSSPKEIIFFPQGLVMCFYGLLAIIFSMYLWFTILWSIGAGFNEFNKKDGSIRIFQSIKVEIREGLNPRRAIYMKIDGNREILLTKLGNPMTLEEIETQASELAKFLQVPLEMVS
jgi:hypothetical protein